MIRDRLASVFMQTGVRKAARVMRSALLRNLSLLLFALLFSMLSPQFLTVSNLENIFRQVSTNAILAFGMSFIIFTGGIDLSVGSIVALSNCLIAGILQTDCHLPFAIIIVLFAGFLFGFVNGLIVTNLRIPAFIATLSTMMIGRGLTNLYTNGKSITIVHQQYLRIANGYFCSIPNLILILFVIFGISSLLLHRTRFGRQVLAIGDNRETASFIGIQINRVECLVYAYSGTLSSLVGILLASRMYSGQPLIGDGAELDAIAAVVIGGASLSGGVGTLFGTLVGVLVIGVMNNGLNLLQIQSYWQQIVKGVFIIAAVYYDVSRSMNKRAAK